MKKIFSVVLSTVLLLTACQKMDMTSGIDIQKYETQLNADYSNASVNHQALTDVSSDSHSSHHSGTNLNPLSNQLIMFNESDSLFSVHFYEFCIEMMKDQDYMSSIRMMSHSGMMGDDADMMSGAHNMDEMAEFMESHHNAQSAMMINSYFEADSLMYAKMSECKMMNKGTEGISAVFDKMQELRLKHKSLHKNF